MHIIYRSGKNIVGGYLVYKMQLQLFRVHHHVCDTVGKELIPHWVYWHCGCLFLTRIFSWSFISLISSNSRELMLRVFSSCFCNCSCASTFSYKSCLPLWLTPLNLTLTVYLATTGRHCNCHFHLIIGFNVDVWRAIYRSDGGGL